MIRQQMMNKLDDQPTKVWNDGTQMYLNTDGQLHRDNDQHTTMKQDDMEEWRRLHMSHQDEYLGPFYTPPDIFIKDDIQIWLDNDGIVHRDGDLPAIIWADETQEWYKHGKLHRDNDKPAIVYANGDQEWWKNGKKYEPEVSKITDDLLSMQYVNNHLHSEEKLGV
jgi:hypothetical protein